MTEHPGLPRANDRRVPRGRKARTDRPQARSVRAPSRTAPPGTPHRLSVLITVRASLAVLLALAVVLTGVGAFSGIAQATNRAASGPASTPAAPWTATSAAHRSAAPTQQAPASATVVQTYFRVVNDRDFVSAWAIGGRQHIAGQTYDAFVRSFNTVTKYDVTIESVEGNKVAVRLDASQTDRTHRHYAGTYTVEDGVIVAADVHPE